MSVTHFSVGRPQHLGVFEFVVVASLRAGQLMRGCTPTINGHTHKAIVIAQLEVAEGTVSRVPAALPNPLVL